MKKHQISRSILGLLMCFVLAVSTVGCGAASSTGTAGSGTEPGASTTAKDTLRVIIPVDVSNLDANDSNIIGQTQVTRNIYETLFVYDNAEGLQTWLCESYEYVDDCTINLKIRQGVKFHDGSELKASDVLFTFQRIFEDALVSLIEIQSLDIEKCNVIDDYTLQLVTTAPAPTLLAKLDMPNTAIISESAYTESNGDFSKGACVGTGPYTLVSHVPGDSVTLKAFDGYWREGEPHIENVFIRTVTDASSRAIEAETGGAEIVYNINPRDIQTVNDAEGVSVYSQMGAFTLHLAANTAVEPLNDPLVREAIWYAVDVGAAVDAAYGDYGSVATGWVSPGVLGYDPSIVDRYIPERDVAKAKELLAQAGYPNGLSLTILVANDSMGRPEVAEALQAQASEAGIDLQIDLNDTAWAISTQGGHELTLVGYTSSTFEADRALSHFRRGINGYEVIKFDDDIFQNTIDQALETLDAEEREQLYFKAIDMMLENHMILPIWHNANTAAVSDDIEGFDISRSYEQLYLQNVSFK